MCPLKSFLLDRLQMRLEIPDRDLLEFAEQYAANRSVPFKLSDLTDEEMTTVVENIQLIYSLEAQ